LPIAPIDVDKGIGWKKGKIRERFSKDQLSVFDHDVGSKE
jgi:hypothetical protein